MELSIEPEHHTRQGVSEHLTLKLQQRRQRETWHSTENNCQTTHEDQSRASKQPTTPGETNFLPRERASLQSTFEHSGRALQATTLLLLSFPLPPPRQSPTTPPVQPAALRASPKLFHHHASSSFRSSSSDRPRPSLLPPQLSNASPPK
ncbi:hypothetical protein Mapa_013026 [Marchantia paleacea]|nr:hypothetical protein Mapa_013026 [Marchantia paleacea]